MSSIDFVLESFNHELTMDVSGAFPDGEPPIDLVTDAVAHVFVKVSDFNSVFMFGTDSVDIENDPATDIKYFVDASKFPTDLTVNPCHAYVYQNAIANAGRDNLIYSDNRMLVKHDFIRHIAKELFNTHLGVDLFSNEDELKYDLASKGHDVWHNPTAGILAKIQKYSMADGTATELQDVVIRNPITQTDITYKFLPDNFNTIENYPRALFKQMMSSTEGKARLLKMADNIIPDIPGVYRIPFADNDSISFKLTLNPQPDQHLLTSVTEVKPRTYRIKMILKDNVLHSPIYDNGTNVEPNDVDDATLGSIFTAPFNGSYPYSTTPNP
jgi:hypothetical protein